MNWSADKGGNGLFDSLPQVIPSICNIDCKVIHARCPRLGISIALESQF